jgi:hypothetical protein
VTERQLIYTLNPAFALVELLKTLLPLAPRHPLCVAAEAYDTREGKESNKNPAYGGGPQGSLLSAAIQR